MGSRIASSEGQASIEAAMLLPTMALLIALLVQPVCILYTRCVMQSAAAEGCRLMMTASQTDESVSGGYTAYVLRRLRAVPNVSIFHEGGDGGWQIELQGSSSDHRASVHIVGTVKPLPLLGVIPSALGQVNEAGDVVLDVSVQQTTRPGWLEGGYDDWSSIW
jgi:hypothetical protein